MENINNKDEQLTLSFMGFKFHSTNPGKKTIIIVVACMIFFLALVVLFKWYALSALAISPVNGFSKAMKSINIIGKAGSPP
jgi:hypothetical protein